MMKVEEKRIYQVFQDIALKYDMVNNLISFNRHKVWRTDSINRINILEGQKVLDVCCGTADYTILLAQKVGSRGKVYGLDFSTNMLAIGREKVAELKLKNVELVQGNAMEIPYPDNSFDVTTISFGLRNVPDYLQVLKEMCRVTKPGGKVACLETSQPTIPVYSQIYYFYFRHIMPLLGKIFTNKYDNYLWLHKSARNFPSRTKLEEMFRQAGLTNIQVKAYDGGVAALHIGVKEQTIISSF